MQNLVTIPFARLNGTVSGILDAGIEAETPGPLPAKFMVFNAKTWPYPFRMDHERQRTP